MTPIIAEPILIANTNVTILIQVLTSKLPNKALALLIRNTDAEITAAIGPVPGKMPKNIPMPKPRAIFCGESLILKILEYVNWINVMKLFLMLFFIV